MDAELAFQLLNLGVMPWWGIWLIAPGSRWARATSSHAGVFLALSLAYTVLIAATLVNGGGGDFDFDGMRAALSTPLGFLAGWTHYLVLDLFVGAWILREARRLELEPRPYLFFALMLAPIGLGAFLIRRVIRLRSFGQIGERDLV